MAQLTRPGGIDALEPMPVGDGVEDAEEEGEGVGQGAVEVEDGESVAHVRHLRTGWVFRR
jgi:hypothetical protein